MFCYTQEKRIDLPRIALRCRSIIYQPISGFTDRKSTQVWRVCRTSLPQPATRSSMRATDLFAMLATTAHTAARIDVPVSTYAALGDDDEVIFSINHHNSYLIRVADGGKTPGPCRGACCDSWSRAMFFMESERGSNAVPAVSYQALGFRAAFEKASIRIRGAVQPLGSWHSRRNEAMIPKIAGFTVTSPQGRSHHLTDAVMKVHTPSRDLP